VLQNLAVVFDIFYDDFYDVKQTLQKMISCESIVSWPHDTFVLGVICLCPFAPA